eukprot:CAMPEP_0117081084 /NCGR_PEP_ID=MMETSP0472-20121206/57176_1 /TAXON_ID=693140 ORGANISM="Tiarina fusus, Strain LIS" /NCGR_SAMPLE_ID=MMETSP0472 /ASSEMBLY_ACC=CAM_ASM_000603 /LENGTH=51 /DNA_ID=CAMNT_0004808923 /DNA_START=257 /DNA_END=408 /DNA_ORIENTATION=+
MFMHHNTFELGTDRFNEAEYVREDLLKALDGSDNVSAFVQQTANQILEILP